MSLLGHPVIASMRDERDVEQPTVEVSALDTWVVEDGDDMHAEHVRTSTWVCFCEDDRHRDIDREEIDHSTTHMRTGAHKVPVHVYAVVGPVIEEKS